jgi:pilus assembly protein FimV
MPERARTLLAGIDLDLSPAKKISPELASVAAVAAIVAEPNPLADALRVKLNLARAYITIEDFAAAKKSLQEIIHIGESIDPVITAEAKGLLLELSRRNN